MMSRRTRYLRKWALTALLMASLVFAMFWSPTTAQARPAKGVGAEDVTASATTAQSSDEAVTADALPTWQINGVVWSQVTVGNIVYATGEFSTARPPGVAKGGAGEISVGNLIAYDIRTGERVSAFSHSLNAQGMTIAKSPDGSRIYVGGDFTAVDGQARGHIAAFDTATGELVPSFHPDIAGRVRAITVSDSTVYAGGEFVSADGARRVRLAAFNASDGSMTSWAPTGDNYYVWSMVLTPDQSKVIVGGQIQKINGVVVNGMGALDPITGGVLPWAANQTIIDYQNGAILGLSTDGNQIFGSGFAFGTGGYFEGEFALNPDTGAINWLNDCQGDTYDTYPMGGMLYTVSHVHNCEMIGGLPQLSDWGIYQRHALAFSTTPDTVNDGPDEYGWNYKGIAASSIKTWFPDVSWGNYTVYGQSGWSVTGNGEYLAMGGEFLSVNGKGQQGLVRYALHDQAPNKMGPKVGYGASAPSATSKLGGTAVVSWNAAWDPDNTNLTYQVFRSGSAEPVYTTTHDSSPWSVPRMSFLDTGLTPGSSQTYTIKASDQDNNTLTIGQATVSVSDAPDSKYAELVLKDGASAYWRLDDTSGSSVADWSGSNDGQSYPGVSFGAQGAITDDADQAAVFDGSTSGYVAAQTELTGPDTFTIEGWFKSTSTNGGKIVGFGNSLTGNSSSYDRHIYMDNAGHVWFGVYPGSVQTVSTTSAYNDGSWHQVVASLGADGMRLYVDGALQAQREDVTSAQNYDGYWRVGGDNLSSWTSQPRSNYFDGTIDEVAIYPSVLTSQEVQDHYALGSSGTPTNVKPSAAFESQVDGLSVSLDGSGSSDSDGSVASYAWDFGDGSAAGSGKTVDHAYASAGTYTVKLTVTDDKGATDSVSHDVTVAAAGDAVVVDDFNRTVTGGLGTADQGGAWSLQGPSSRFSVNGQQGQLDMTAAGSGASAFLNSVSESDVDMSVDVSLDKVPQSGSVYTSAVVRTSGNSYYAAKLRWTDAGTLEVYVTRTVNGTETTLASGGGVLSGLAGDDVVTLRFQASGTSPTSLKAKVWKAGTGEPQAWTLSTTDSSAALQSAGGIGLVTYLSGAAANAPIKAGFDNLIVYPSDNPPPPAR